MTKFIQPSLVGGEISPPIGARIDLSKRAVSVELAQNFFARVSGSLESRPGQRFVARAKGDTVRLIPFEFNTEQTFIIELGNQYARFHTDGAQILDSSSTATITAATQASPGVITATAHGFSDDDEIFITGVVGMEELNGRNLIVDNATANTFTLKTLDGVAVNTTAYTAYASGGTATKVYEIATPWPDSILFDLRYDQSGDVISIVHPDYPPQEIVRLDNDNWSIAAIDFVPDHPAPTSLLAEAKNSPDPGYLSISSITRANPGVVTTSTAHGMVDGDMVRIWAGTGMDEIKNFVYEVDVLSTTTFSLIHRDTGASIDTSGFSAYTSGARAEVGSYEQPRKYGVTAISADTGEESFLALVTATAYRADITGITKANPCVITTSRGHGFRTGDELEILSVGGMTELNGRRFRAEYVDNTTFNLLDLYGNYVDTTDATTYTSGGAAYRTYFEMVNSKADDWENYIYWNAVEGTARYNVYASETGGQLQYIGTTTGPQFRDNYISPDPNKTPPDPANPFFDLTGTGDKYPGAVGFFEQRRLFGNTNEAPNKMLMSQTGRLYNFSRSSPLRDDDAIIASVIARRINAIQHFVHLNDLLVMTSGGEFRVFGDQGVMTPSTINIKSQSYYGSTSLPPIVSGDVALFVSPGQYIRDMKYQFSDDKFVGRDITVLARHLFDNRELVDWAYSSAPYSTIWALRDDGLGLILTYQPEQDVYAWCRAVTRGDYKSVAVVREGSIDEVYFAVRRPLPDGSRATFIEKLDARQFNDLQDAFCVDCGLTYDQPMTVTNVSQALPMAITVDGDSGLSPGDIIDISDIFEVNEDNCTCGETLSADYNGTGFIVGTVSPGGTNFTVLTSSGDPVDSSAFAAYSSGGRVRKAVTTVSGLWHLEGATVVAAANGYAETDLTVTNGSVTLSAPASRIHIGLSYACRMSTLPLTVYSDGRTNKGQAKNINRLTMQVERTMGMWYGPNFDEVREAKFGLPDVWGQPLTMITDDIDLTMKPGWDKNKRVVIEQRTPQPITILAMIPDIVTGGN